MMFLFFFYQSPLTCFLPIKNSSGSVLCGGAVKLNTRFFSVQEHRELFGARFADNAQRNVGSREGGNCKEGGKTCKIGGWAPFPGGPSFFVGFPLPVCLSITDSTDRKERTKERKKDRKNKKTDRQIDGQKQRKKDRRKKQSLGNPAKNSLAAEILPTLEKTFLLSTKLPMRGRSDRSEEPNDVTSRPRRQRKGIQLFDPDLNPRLSQAPGGGVRASILNYKNFALDNGAPVTVADFRWVLG
jgi:hypothetical protein